MVILALETSMGLSSVAIRRSDGDILMEVGGPAREQAENLLPLIGVTMASAGVTYRDLTRIAVTTGPGTFTGIRASLAAARGFALALGAPVVGVPSLEVMAHIFVAGHAPSCPFIVAAPAGRDLIYTQAFDVHGAPTSEAVVRHQDDLAAWSNDGRVILAGPAAAFLSSAQAPDLAPNASALAEMASLREPALKPPSPLYLRLADAKPQQGGILARAARQ